MTNPLGIDDTHPGLSWIAVNKAPGARGQSQIAYQLQAASTPERLTTGAPDLWDSGKVISSQSVDIPYSGKALLSNQQCFWRVRIWDQDSKISNWSVPAFWTIGMLDQNSWKAHWIGAPSPPVWRDYTIETSFTIEHEAASIYFRANGPGNAYMWQINTTGDRPVFRPHIRINGGYTVLKNTPLPGSYTDADFLKPHTLRIAVTGSTITTFLDNTEIDTTVNDQVPSGSIGFRASNTETATFRDIHVTDSSGKTLFADTLNLGEKNQFSAGIITAGGLTVTNTDSVLLSTDSRTELLRRTFTATKPVRRAWLYCSALGIYEPSMNGARVGDRYFAPGWTNYYHRVQYQCNDVTHLLHIGANAIGAELAPGWYCGKIGWFGPNQYGGDTPAFFAELHIQYTDGSSKIVASDSAWKFGQSPVTFADNLDGESYDARLEQSGWDTPTFNDADWKNVAIRALPPGVRLVAQMDPPVRATQVVRAISVTQSRPGVYIYKLPQDITGVARVRMSGDAGATAVIRQAEALNPDGTLNFATLASPGIPNMAAEATDRYTFARTGAVTFQPEFTFHGFQYIEVSGVSVQPAIADVAGVVYGTDVPHIGSLVTSSGFINQLQSNLQWSGRDAYMSIPMDCPQRTERLGWTGDANFYVPSAAFNFDMAAFYSKWERDIVTDGQFNNVAPTWSADITGGTGGGWGDVGLDMPYVLWQSYGDTDILRYSYAGMASWIDFLSSRSPGLITDGSVSAPGDWMNGGEGTDQGLIATAYFAYDTKLLSEMAAAAGHPTDEAKYEALFQNIKKAFTDRFVNADGVVGNGSQTSCVLALYIGLLPDNLIRPVTDHLIANVAAHHNHLTTGFVGTQWLLTVLSKIGRPDLAYAILEQTTQPSWGYMLSHGATTIWENWHVMADDGSIPSQYSLNHCALGSFGDWMYRNIGGLSPDPAFPGYKRFIVDPVPGGGLTHASASYLSYYGKIAVSWRLEKQQFALDLTVPVNTSATVYLPAQDPAQITEGGIPAINSPGVKFTPPARDKTPVIVGSGQYQFICKLPQSRTR